MGRIIKSRIATRVFGRWKVTYKIAGIDRSVYDDLFGDGRRPKLYGLIAIQTVRVRWTLTLVKGVLMLISVLNVILEETFDCSL